MILKSTVHGTVPIGTAPIVVNEITLVGSRCGRFECALPLLEHGLIPVEQTISAVRYALSAAGGFRHRGATRYVDANPLADMTQLGEKLFYNLVAGHLQPVVTGVKTHAGAVLPKQFSLAQNFPNPFNPATSIQYSLPSTSNVTLTVYNVLGQHVATLVNTEQTAGLKSAVWNANAFASGVYFYKLKATSAGSPARTFTDVKKLVLLK